MNLSYKYKYPFWDNESFGGGKGASIYAFSETLMKILYNYDTRINQDTILVLEKFHWPLCNYWEVEA